MLSTSLRSVALAATTFLFATAEGVRAISVQQRATCQSFSTNFPAGSVTDEPSSAPFYAISPRGSYAVENNELQMYLMKPDGTITRKGRTNNQLGSGATLNSSFTMQYGRVAFDIEAPAVAGVVTASILFGSEQHDEIDIEILGGDPTHWQTNVYSPKPQDKSLLQGVFGQVEDIPSGSSITDFHTYAIDWTEDAITWSIDGREVRTVSPGDTIINGTSHFPSHSCRIQLGIWDASSPAGTSKWAKGPIDWDKAPSTIVATIRNITVSC